MSWWSRMRDALGARRPQRVAAPPLRRRRTARRRRRTSVRVVRGSRTFTRTLADLPETADAGCEDPGQGRPPSARPPRPLRP